MRHTRLDGQEVASSKLSVVPFYREAKPPTERVDRYRTRSLMLVEAGTPFKGREGNVQVWLLQERLAVAIASLPGRLSLEPAQFLVEREVQVMSSELLSRSLRAGSCRPWRIMSF